MLWGNRERKETCALHLSITSAKYTNIFQPHLKCIKIQQLHTILSSTNNRNYNTAYSKIAVLTVVLYSTVIHQRTL